jgi:predicted small lipoprotein YifL
MRRLLALAVLLAVSACGQKTGLVPEAGKQLPPPPYGREDRKSAEALLTPPTQAIPERSVELRRRSEEREDDPFDLPPPE